MRRKALAALSLAVFLAACGGGSSHDSNEHKIDQARRSEASAQQIHQKLHEELQLHPYAGVDDTFTIPPGRPDVYAGESGKQCTIDLIEVGKQAVQLYSGDEAVLVSPGDDAVVKVGTFQGTALSDCLEAVRKALGW